MGWRAMVLLPGALVPVLSALPSGVAANSAIPRTDPAATTDPFPPVPGLYLLRNGENPFVIARRYKISLS
jgi:hypothetical protein